MSVEAEKCIHVTRRDCRGIATGCVRDTLSVSVMAPGYSPVQIYIQMYQMKAPQYRPVRHNPRYCT